MHYKPFFISFSLYPEMTNETTILKTITEKYPKYETSIMVLFLVNESFREICEDYVMCLNSIKKIKSKQSEQQKNLKEFLSTQVELENDLINILKKKS